MSSSRAIVILAAGKGKRMGNPDIPKVMVHLAGMPLIGHVLREVSVLSPERIVAIVGHHKEQVIEYVAPLYPHVEFAEQREQLGTGHAVQQGEQALNGYQGTVLIICGDTPLLKAKTLNDFCSDHEIAGADVSVLSCIMPQPTGYGRIVRNTTGEFTEIVEERDATDEQRLITEVNSGVYAVNAQVLFSTLQRVGNANSQGEYYLTDIIAILAGEGKKLAAFIAPSAMELQGINNPEELSAAEEFLLQFNTKGELQ